MTLKALWWKEEGEKARCGLCFHRCLLAAGGTGYCGVRRWNGEIFSSPYLGNFSSCAVDPIEKKPLYHWRPGSCILSLGGIGCCMRCPFCQNHSIAQPQSGQSLSLSLAPLSPADLLLRLRQQRLSAVAYTYNEPVLQAEYILEAAPLLKEAGIATVLVTNGMFSAEALEDAIPWLDAVNVDLKTFDAAKYAQLGGSLETVKYSIVRMIRSGIHVELTNLVVPDISDSHEDFARMVEWIASISPEIPLHVSRYFPAYRYSAPPTDVGLVRNFAAFAGTKLRHVHTGNIW